MQNQRAIILRWGPVVVWMAAIFLASATPSRELPSLGSFDFVAKKTGHSVAYALLALLLRRALQGSTRRDAGAWLVAAIYGLLDEFHQSFVPGRHPSLVDALLFDGGGAALAVLLSQRVWPAKRESGAHYPETP